MEVSRDRLRLKALQSHPRGTESSTALVQCPSPPMKALSSMVSPSANEPSQEKTKTQDMGNACMDFASLYDFDLIYCVALQPEAQAQARSLKSIEFLAEYSENGQTTVGDENVFDRLEHFSDAIQDASLEAKGYQRN